MCRTHQKIEQIVEEIVEEIIQKEQLPLELVDVEFVKERDWYLRVYLDKEGGLDLEDCQLISIRLEAKLDELDPISESYYLEVSSPGLDRQLKKDKDFLRHIGDEVEVHTYSPFKDKKKWVGILKGYEDHSIQLDVNGELMEISRDKISVVRLYLEF